MASLTHQINSLKKVASKRYASQPRQLEIEEVQKSKTRRTDNPYAQDNKLITSLELQKLNNTRSSQLLSSRPNYPIKIQQQRISILKL